MNARVTFGKIDRLALFGGSWVMAAVCRWTASQGMHAHLFTAARHMDGEVGPSGETLRQVVDETGIPVTITDDINREPALGAFVTSGTLGLAFGAAWIFSRETAALFGGRLLDFMGIPLPRLRGGAHYTWQILMQDRQGSCNLQLIKGGEETFHRGPIVLRSDYRFPDTARIPQDYFEAAVPIELAFVQGFLEQVRRGATFTQQHLDESSSSYFPFLYTPAHGLIDWSWTGDDIARFICAFDRPYRGASTWLDGRRIFLQDARSDATEGPFHPFQAGLVYRITASGLFVAARGGAVVVGRMIDESGQEIHARVRLGQRCHTPRERLDRVLRHEIEYDGSGMKPVHSRQTTGADSEQ